MKSDVTHKRFPETPEEWEALIAQAPGEDRAPTAEEEAAWDQAVIVRGGGYPAFKAAWDERRRTRETQQISNEQAFSSQLQFVLCIDSSRSEDLEKGKVYQVMLDHEAAAQGLLRVIDESDKDHLYPAKFFVELQLPQHAIDALAA